MVPNLSLGCHAASLVIAANIDTMAVLRTNEGVITQRRHEVPLDHLVCGHGMFEHTARNSSEEQHPVRGQAIAPGRLAGRERAGVPRGRLGGLTPSCRLTDAGSSWPSEVH